MPVSFVLQVVTASKTQCRRDAASRVPGHEEVVITFVGIWVAHQATLRPNGGKIVEASRDQLVRIDLMPGVPDHAVPAEVVNTVERQGQFDDAQVGRKVGRSLTKEVAERISNFFRELLQLSVRHLSKQSGRRQVR